MSIRLKANLTRKYTSRPPMREKKKLSLQTGSTITFYIWEKYFKTQTGRHIRLAG